MIRRATVDDAEEIYRLLVQMHQENGIFPMSEPKVRFCISECINRGLVLVDRVNGTIIATMGAGFQELWYSDTVLLGDYWMYVRKGHRKSSAAPRMLRAFKAAAKTIGCPLGVGVFSPVDTERKNALFRRFFTPVGERYVEGF